MKYFAYAIAVLLLGLASVSAQERGLNGSSMKDVTVFYDEGGKLKPEIRSIPREAFEEFEIRSVIDGLIKGSKSYTRVIPESARLKRVLIDNRKIVYLDFNDEFVKDHPSGVAAEILTIASLCRSIFTNFDVSGIKILSEGRELKTITGHVDIESPITRLDVQEWLTVRKR